MKKIEVIVIAVVVMFFACSAVAAEKPLVFKGLYIGMNANDARNIFTKKLSKEWKLSDTGKTSEILPSAFSGDDRIFGIPDRSLNGRRLDANIGEYGFAIINKEKSYEGFISVNPQSGKVIRISFSGQITDILFSTANISIDEFVSSLYKHYNMPEFGWIRHGWIYTSPLGYIVTIYTDKFIDVKDKEFQPQRINFD
jgi:hypothetical protein